MMKTKNNQDIVEIAADLNDDLLNLWDMTEFDTLEEFCIRMNNTLNSYRGKFIGLHSNRSL